MLDVKSQLLPLLTTSGNAVVVSGTAYSLIQINPTALATVSLPPLSETIEGYYIYIRNNSAVFNVNITSADPVDVALPIVVAPLGFCLIYSDYIYANTWRLLQNYNQSFGTGTVTSVTNTAGGGFNLVLPPFTTTPTVKTVSSTIGNTITDSGLNLQMNTNRDESAFVLNMPAAPYNVVYANSYTNIQTAITAASASFNATNPINIQLTPGTYSNNLTLAPGVNLYGVGNNGISGNNLNTANNNGVIITAAITLPASNNVILDSIVFTDCTITASTGGAVFRNCVFINTTFDISTLMAGELTIDSCTASNANATYIFTNNSNTVINFNDSTIGGTLSYTGITGNKLFNAIDTTFLGDVMQVSATTGVKNVTNCRFSGTNTRLVNNVVGNTGLLTYRYCSFTGTNVFFHRSVTTLNYCELLVTQVNLDTLGRINFNNCVCTAPIVGTTTLTEFYIRNSLLLTITVTGIPTTMDIANSVFVTRNILPGDTPTVSIIDSDDGAVTTSVNIRNCSFNTVGPAVLLSCATTNNIPLINVKNCDIFVFGVGEAFNIQAPNFRLRIDSTSIYTDDTVTGFDIFFDTGAVIPVNDGLIQFDSVSTLGIINNVFDPIQLFITSSFCNGIVNRYGTTFALINVFYSTIFGNIVMNASTTTQLGMAGSIAIGSVIQSGDNSNMTYTTSNGIAQSIVISGLNPTYVVGGYGLFLYGAGGDAININMRNIDNANLQSIDLYGSKFQGPITIVGETGTATGTQVNKLTRFINCVVLAGPLTGLTFPFKIFIDTTAAIAQTYVPLVIQECTVDRIGVEGIVQAMINASTLVGVDDATVNSNTIHIRNGAATPIVASELTATITNNIIKTYSSQTSSSCVFIENDRPCILIDNDITHNATDNRIVVSLALGNTDFETIITDNTILSYGTSPLITITYNLDTLSGADTTPQSYILSNVFISYNINNQTAIHIDGTGTSAVSVNVREVRLYNNSILMYDTAAPSATEAVVKFRNESYIYAFNNAITAGGQNIFMLDRPGATVTALTGIQMVNNTIQTSNNFTNLLLDWSSTTAAAVATTYLAENFINVGTVAGDNFLSADVASLFGRPTGGTSNILRTAAATNNYTATNAGTTV